MLLFHSVFAVVFAGAVGQVSVSASPPNETTPGERVWASEGRAGPALQRERPDDPWRPREPQDVAGGVVHCGPWVFNGYVSFQVNVDGNGCNIVGDAANEPSLAIVADHPTDIVIGFRQFDTISSNFRQAGYAYSHNGGTSWTFPGVLQPAVFRTDPVLASDAEGNIYYLSMVSDASLSFVYCDLWKTSNGGVSWDEPVYAYGGDKAWFAIDRTHGLGHGNMYTAWDHFSCCGYAVFARSTNAGASFEDPHSLPNLPEFGTIAVGPNGEVYVSGVTAQVLRSLNAQDPSVVSTFQYLANVDLGGEYRGWGGPNPGGLLGQSWIACDHTGGGFRGNVYALTSVRLYDGSDPLDVMFARSASRGVRWSRPRRVNDDPRGNGAYQWFGTLSVAPNGRIDVIWNDTRSRDTQHSALYYSASVDAGRTWSPNVQVSPVFDSWIGWPNQHKIGDYYHSVSDRGGVNVAYAATFNGEQDVYFLRIPADCNGNHIADALEIAARTTRDDNDNGIPDDCEPDIDGDGVPDIDDTDLDGDGVENVVDRCPFGPAGVRAQTDGTPFGDINRDCLIDLNEHYLWTSVYECYSTSGPGLPSPNGRCRGFLDSDADTDIDLHDIAEFQRAFGQDGS